MDEKSKFVVSAHWLSQRIGQQDLKIVDASWYLPAQNRNAREEFDTGHIAGAVFFDQDTVVEPGADLPHTLPGADVFAGHAAGLGLSHDDVIIVYDGLGMFTAPRVWWMLRTMGAKKVFVLDGGLAGWVKEGYPVTKEATVIQPGNFAANLDRKAVAGLADMRAIVDDKSMQIVDARGSGRFTGEEPEPREGMRSGHMPGACNVPVFSLSVDGYLKSLDALRETLSEAGVDLNSPVVTTCGSGVTAAVITLALESLGSTESKLYDGSWSQWGALEDTPIATGDA